MASRPNRLGVLTTACAVALCAFLLVEAKPVSAYSASSALADLNTMRASAGVPRLGSFNRRMNAGCRMHNRYMSATGQFGHFESRSSAHYTRSGARAAASSVIAQPTALPSGAWGDTVYHRIAVLQPRLKRSGYSGNYGFSCMQVISGLSNSKRARTKQLSLYPWPGNGATGLDPSFDGNEFPDPLADAPGASDLGTPITVNINGPWKYWQQARSYVRSASMVSDGGEGIPLSISDVTSPNGAFLQGGFALLPRRPLSDNTGYTYSASGTVRYRGRSWPFTINSRFSTGVDPF